MDSRPFVSWALRKVRPFRWSMQCWATTARNPSNLSLVSPDTCEAPLSNSGRFFICVYVSSIAACLYTLASMKGNEWHCSVVVIGSPSRPVMEGLMNRSNSVCLP